jgi:hypothetical protein
MYFSRPCETEIPSPLNRALKRRAAIRRPSGTRVKVQTADAIKVRMRSSPGGTSDNSPPLQWRDGNRRRTRAVGTIETKKPVPPANQPFLRRLLEVPPAAGT